MTTVRFLIDDVNQSQTQRAVLQVFATDLQNQSLGDVVWASEIPNISTWNEVPSESSRQLGLRLFALSFTTSDQLTIFIPGHIVPGMLNKPVNIDHAIATNSFTTVRSLDLFIINNASPELSQFQIFTKTNSDYEQLSNFELFSISELPDWLTYGGLKSCLNFTDRPWYSVFAPSRSEWLIWVQRALRQGNLTISMVQEDIHNGLARPSLLDDLKQIINNQALTSFPCTASTLDSLFIFPECRLSDTQYRLLHSKSLQARTLEFAKQQHKRKQKQLKSRTQLAYSILKDRRIIIKKFRSLFKKSIKLAHLTAYTIYTISLRPLVKKLFNRDNL